MKKLISTICVLAIMMIAGFGGGIAAFAGTYEEECDLVFFKALEQILNDEGIVVETIEIEKDPIYDLSLNQLGYVYTMDILENEGFALIINTDGVFEVAEMYLNAANPYNEYNGQNIYVNLLFYLIYEEEQFIETSTGIALDNEILETIKEKAFYAGDGVMWLDSETIYYTSRVPNSFSLATRYPCNTPTGISNGCTPTAGANIIHYYTRFYPNFIPNFEPGYYFADRYVYNEESDEVIPITHTLYNYMKTNVTAPGTTIVEFKTGMTKFVNEKGRNISYNSCMKNGVFSMDLAKQRFNEGMPVVLFVDTFTVASIMNDTQGKYEGISYTFANACHAMAGFGYQEITYTLTSGQTRKDTYIAVATGLSSHVKGYYNINLYTQIDEIYAINIY